MPDVGVPELLIVAVVVLLLFGPGKAADIGGALGKSIREFRKASTEDDHPATATATLQSAPSAALPAAPIATSDVAPIENGAPTANRARFCTDCGAGITEAQKFCVNCGAPAPALAAV